MCTSSIAQRQRASARIRLGCHNICKMFAPTGRSKADAPEIDGEVHLRDAGGLEAGNIVLATIEHSDKHDPYGVPAKGCRI